MRWNGAQLADNVAVLRHPLRAVDEQNLKHHFTLNSGESESVPFLTTAGMHN
jgi:hypothetical protein